MGCWSIFLGVEMKKKKTSLALAQSPTIAIASPMCRKREIENVFFFFCFLLSSQSLRKSSSAKRRRRKTIPLSLSIRFHLDGLEGSTLLQVVPPPPPPLPLPPPPPLFLLLLQLCHVLLLPLSLLWQIMSYCNILHK